MNGQHAIDLRTKGIVGPEFALTMLLAAWDHALFDAGLTMLVRSQTLTTLRDARYRVVTANLGLRELSRAHG